MELSNFNKRMFNLLYYSIIFTIMPHIRGAFCIWDDDEYDKQVKENWERVIDEIQSYQTYHSQGFIFLL